MTAQAHAFAASFALTSVSRAFAQSSDAPFGDVVTAGSGEPVVLIPGRPESRIARLPREVR